MFGLAACDVGGPGFVDASVRTITNAKQVGMRNEKKVYRHASECSCWCKQRKREDGTIRNMDTRRCPSKGRPEETGRAGVEDVGTEEESKGCKEVHENDDEQALLNLWQGWHWDDTKGGWLDPELCAKARREEVEYILRHKMHTRVPRETCVRETRKSPIKTG